MIRTLTLLSIVTLASLPTFVFAQALPALPINGNFDVAGSSWQFPADGWTRTGHWGDQNPPNNVKREIDGKNPYLWVVSGAGMAKAVVIAVSKDPVLLNPEWISFKVRFRSRLSDLEVGTNPWDRARVQLSFKTADGQTMNKYPAVNIEPSTEWHAHEGIITIPAGAHSVSVQFGFWNSQGNLDLDDLEVIPMK